MEAPYGATRMKGAGNKWYCQAKGTKCGKKSSKKSGGGSVEKKVAKSAKKLLK